MPPLTGRLYLEHRDQQNFGCGKRRSQLPETSHTLDLHQPEFPQHLQLLN